VLHPRFHTSLSGEIHAELRRYKTGRFAEERRAREITEAQIVRAARNWVANSCASNSKPKHAYVAGCNVAAVLRGLRDALVGVGHRTRSRLVKGLQLSDLKSRRRNEFVNLTV
jgi:hypothetical protein